MNSNIISKSKILKTRAKNKNKRYKYKEEKKQVREEIYKVFKFI